MSVSTLPCGKILVNGRAAVVEEITTCNGLLVLIDEVLVPRRDQVNLGKEGKDSPFDPYHPADEDVDDDEVGNPSPVELKCPQDRDLQLVGCRRAPEAIAAIILVVGILGRGR